VFDRHRWAHSCGWLGTSEPGPYITELGYSKVPFRTPDLGSPLAAETPQLGSGRGVVVHMRALVTSLVVASIGAGGAGAAVRDGDERYTLDTGPVLAGAAVAYVPDRGSGVARIWVADPTGRVIARAPASSIGTSAFTLRLDPASRRLVRAGTRLFLTARLTDERYTFTAPRRSVTTTVQGP
jgi:hypothetical protein